MSDIKDSGQASIEKRVECGILLRYFRSFTQVNTAEMLANATVSLLLFFGRSDVIFIFFKSTETPSQRVE